MEDKPMSVTVRLDYQDAVTYLADVTERIRLLNLIEKTGTFTNGQVNTRKALRRVREKLMDALDPSRAQ